MSIRSSLSVNKPRAAFGSACAGIVALLLFAAGPASAQTASSPPCVEGGTRGSWDLPEPGQAGAVDGLLVTERGTRVFRLRGVLAERPSTGTPGRRGRLAGVLVPVGSTTGSPFARVVGEWVARPDGQGHFRAAIVKRTASGRRLIGRIRGRFDDPPSLPNTAGTYRGRWTICR